MKKIDALKYLSEWGMIPEIAHFAGIENFKIANAVKRMRRGENIKPATKTMIFRGINKREGGGLVMGDIIW